MNFKRYIEVVVKGTDKSGPLWSQLGGNLKKLVTDKKALAAAAAAAGAAIVSMVRRAVTAYNEAITKAGQFQKAVLEAGTLTGTNAAQTRELSKNLQDLAVKYGQLDDVMARAQYNVASAGFADVADSLAILDVASRAAIGGITDVNTAAKAITQTLNAYRMGADQAESVAGILFATIKGGVTTFEELAPALGMVTSTAAAAKIPLEQVAAAMAVLTKNGLTTNRAATALNSLILAIGGASGETGEKLDDLGISLDRGLGPALAAVGEAAGGSLDKLAELIPNIEAIRAAASIAADGGAQFTEQLAAMTQGVSDFNEAYRIMSESYDQAVKRNEAATKRLDTAVGSTALEGKTAALNGMADGADAVAKSIEGSSSAVTLFNRSAGEAWGWVNRVNGQIEAAVVQFGNAALAAAMFGPNGQSMADALLLIDRNAKAASESLAGLLPDPSGAGAGPLGPFDPEAAKERVAEAARAAANAGLAAAAEAWGVTNTTPVFNAESGQWIDVEKSAQEIADEITAAYAAASERLKAAPPTIEKDWTAAGEESGEDDPLVLYEDLMNADLARAEMLTGYYGDGDGERLANLNGFLSPEQLKAIGDEADEHISRLQASVRQQQFMADAVKDTARNFERLASNSLSAMLSGQNGAIMFGRALRTVVMDALSAVIAKLITVNLLTRALNFIPGVGGAATAPGVTPVAFGGRPIPRAAYGYTVPDHGARPGMDSQLLWAMPGETVVDRSLSAGLRRFLAQTESGAIGASAVGSGGRGNVSVLLQVARPVGYLDVLDLGNAAAVAARKVAETELTGRSRR